MTDARMIFATNEDLRKAVQGGRFREDLFYRIHVVPIELPALRHRKEDIRELAMGFLDQACLEFDRQIGGFSPSAMEMMHEYPWPGNIRELENTIQRAVLVCLGDRIESRDLQRLMMHHDSLNLDTRNRPDNLDETLTTMDWSEKFRDLDDALWEPERAILLGALKAYGWNRKTTAQRLGINRTTLYKKMKRLGIESVN
jgi:DNA-binding NtrC family response regulator